MVRNQGNLNVVHISRKHSILTDAQKTNKDYLFDYLRETSPGKHVFQIVDGKKLSMPSKIL